MPPAQRTKSRATASRNRTTSPTTPLTEGTTAEGLPGFLPPPPSPRPPSDELPPNSRLSDLADDSYDEPEAQSTPDLSTPASTEPVKVDKLALIAAIAKLVAVIGFLLHNALAPKDIDNDLWIADDDDQAGIAEPVGSIVARRNPVMGASSDIGDGIAAGFASVGYVIKNLAKRQQLRAQRNEVWKQQQEQSAADAQQ